MSSFFTKVIADILNTTAPIQYPTDGIRTSAAKRPPFLMEYSEEEKKKMGIPAGAESSGGKWYVKDKYVGYVEDGEFIHADSTEDVGTIAKVDGKHFYKVPGKPDREVYVRGRYVYTKPGPGGPANRAYLLGTTSGGGLTLAPTPPLWPGEEPEEQDDSSPVEKFISIQSKKNSVLSPLFDALRADNPEQIQTAVTELMLYRDEDGVLVSNRQGVGHLYGKDEKGVQAAQQLEALLSQHDIKIPNKRQLETSSAKAESFKPQNIPEGVQRAKISVARDDSGETTSFTFDGQTYDVIHQSPELRTRLVEEYFPLYEIFLKRGMSPEEAEQEAERVGKSITAHNKKIKLIAHETSERKDAFLEVTDNTVLGKTLARLVIEAAGENFTEQQRKTLEDIFTTLANAETPDAFDEMWSDATTMRRVAGIQTNTRYLLPLLRGANLPESAFPSLCESIEVLRKSAGGARVLIPTRQTFELVDIVVLRDAISISPESLEDVDKLTDDIAQQLQLVNVQVELVGVKSGQKGVGRPSASYTRILLTEYDTPETGADLLELLGHRSHTDLWQCATKDEFDQYAAKQLAKIQEYIDDVVEYYRFQDAVAGKDDAEKMRIVFALLANGTLPAYDANGEFLRAGREASLFRAEGVTELNREQMRLYSFIGYAADAIYNRRAQLQGFTNTTFGGVRIKETDGIEQMARAVFQFNRSASAWKNPKTQKTVIRPSYSFTANLEYTGALDDMQQFTRRGAREEEPTNELLLEYTVAQKREIGIPLDAIAKGGKWYIGDKLDGKVVGVGDAKNYVKASPEEIAADSGKPPKKRKPAEPRKRQYSGASAMDALNSRMARDKVASEKEGAKLTTVARYNAISGLVDIITQLKNAKSEKQRTELRNKLEQHIKNFNINLGNSGRLKFGDSRLEIFPYTNEELSDVQRLAKELVQLTKKLGVEIPKGSQLNTDEYKPQRIFEESKPVGLSVTRNPDSSVVVQGTRLDRKNEDAVANAWITKINEGRKAKGLTPLSEEETKAVEQLARYRARAHNHNMSQLETINQQYPNLQILEFPSGGQSASDAAASMMSQMIAKVTANVPEDRREAIADAMKDYAAAKTVQEADAAYARIVEAGAGTVVVASMKNLAEGLQAIRVVARGGRAFIPLKEDFPMMDVIAIQNDPIENVPTVYTYLIDGSEPRSEDDEFDISVALSVKVAETIGDRRSGAASSNRRKIENSVFNSVGGVDARAVKEDLLTFSGAHLNSRIFNQEHVDDNGYHTVDKKTLKEIKSYLKKYRSVIIQYYGLNAKITDEQLYHMLSSGRDLGCGPDGMPMRSSDGESSQKCMSMNGPQWQAHSVVGKMTEAIHNMALQEQYYQTTVFGITGGMKRTNGYSTFSKMVIQYEKGVVPLIGTRKAAEQGPKKPSRPKKRTLAELFILNMVERARVREKDTPAVKPETLQVAHTLPSTREELTNGNPCSRGNK